MRGYSTLKQYIRDYELYRTARKVDPGRDGETITSFMKKQIDSRLAKAAKPFKAMLARNKYSVEDLQLIATHDIINSIDAVDLFISECFNTNYASPRHYEKLLKSRAFRSGRLKRLYDQIPVRIDTKKEFTRFIRLSRGVSKPEMKVIMKALCRKNWQAWLDELEDSGTVQERRGRWIA